MPIPNQISLSEAVNLTTRFRSNPAVDLPFNETFDAFSVLKLLNQSECTAFRIYYGRKPDNSICSILVAVNSKGEDILPPSQITNMTTEDEGIILEDALHCPPACPPASPLNS